MTAKPHFLRASLVLLGMLWLAVGIAQAQMSPAADKRLATQAVRPAAGSSPPTASRPRVGLVLSGGGARGLAHVGVLKVLERERIPVDVIAGTSMGAIIGGLYASGMTADDLERELLRVDWSTIFASRVSRQELSQRRKEEDFEISPVMELGMRDGELRAPLGALSGRGLESLLRRYTLDVRSISDFDRLPIPFRAVATNMESGQAVVFSEGDLAVALRSSMSVPGVFPPTEVDDRILGDGGLVNNVPVDVARAMGAQIVIAVNIGTPLSGRETLSSVGGLTAQMINILTEQNVQRSLATLNASDVLIAPDLGTLGASDFARTRELIDLGMDGANGRATQLAALSLPQAEYTAWRASHLRAPVPERTIDFIQFAGTEVTNPARFAAQLESAVGQTFDPARAERDARKLAATGDYMRADYKLVSTPAGDGLVFDLEDKPWGPHYFRMGLDMFTNFAGQSAFNVKLSHNRHWLDQNGSEWRNQIQIGEVPRVFTELYHPLNWTLGISNDWFVAGSAELERREVSVYNNATGNERGRFKRTMGRLGLDLGQPWGELGSIRLGLSHMSMRSEPEILSIDYAGPRDTFILHETGIRLRVVVDQLDSANFPRRGYRVDAGTVTGTRRASEPAGSRERFTRFEGDVNLVGTWGPHTFNSFARVLHADQGVGTGLGRYSLGGFGMLSGYEPGQVEGNYLLFGRLTYYRRLAHTPLLTRGLYLGGSLEAGNAWERSNEMSLGRLRTGSSLFLGLDTGIGPLFFGLTHAPRGDTGLFLFLGRP